MKILMLSTDSNIFEKNSAVRARMIEYGTLCEELHIIVSCTKNSKFKIQNSKLSENVFIYSTNSLSRLFCIFDAYKIAKRVFQNSKFKIQNSLITCQDPFEIGVVGWWIARSLGAKLQLQIHTDFMSPYFAKENIKNKIRVNLAWFLLPRADCVRVVSERIKKSIVDITRAPIAVLPIFTDIKQFQNADGEHIRAQFPQFEKIILVVSRLESEKNVARAIEVFEKTVKKNTRSCLIIVGDGGQKNKLISEVKNKKLEKNVLFIGVQKEIASYYAAADAYLQTSLYEGYGLALIEAYVAGLPIVTTDVGVAGELVLGDGVFLCPVCDVGCLDMALGKALSGDRRFVRPQNEVSKEAYLLAYKKQWESCGFQS